MCGAPPILFWPRPSLMGTTLRVAPNKSHAFSTNYHACIAMPTWPRYAPPILFWPWPPYNLLPRSCLTWIFFVYPRWWVPLCVQCPAKFMPFKQIIMHALQCQHDVDVHLLFCLTLTSIDLLLPSSCITWIFFVVFHWWVPLCVQHPTIYMLFRQIIMYILQCPHDIHVHLFCFDLHKFLLRSRAVTCPTSNCGRGTSLFRQELVYTKRKYTNSWTHFVDFLLWPKSATLFHSFFIIFSTLLMYIILTLYSY